MKVNTIFFCDLIGVWLHWIPAQAQVHDWAWHYDHLANIVLVPLLLQKQPWPIEAFRSSLDPWRCVMVSATNILATDYSSLVSPDFAPPKMGLRLAHPRDGWPPSSIAHGPILMRVVGAFSGWQLLRDVMINSLVGILSFKIFNFFLLSP